MQNQFQSKVLCKQVVVQQFLFAVYQVEFPYAAAKTPF
jgi:hypothetical protein